MYKAAADLAVPTVGALLSYFYATQKQERKKKAEKKRRPTERYKYIQGEEAGFEQQLIKHPYPDKQFIKKMRGFSRLRKKRRYSSRTRTSVRTNSGGKRKAGPKRRRRTLRSTRVSLKKRVRTLEQKTKTNTSYIDFRQLSANTTRSAFNTQAWQELYITNADIENCMDQTRFYDATTNAFINNDVEGFSAMRSYFVSVYFLSVKIRNNYQVPVRVRVHYLRCTEDTNNGIAAIHAAEAADNVLNYSALTDPLIDVGTMAPKMYQTWKPIKKVSSAVLQPGEEMICAINTKPFNYDPSIIDETGQTYNKSTKDCGIYFNVKGVVSHDSAAAEYTITAAGVDYQVFKRVKLHYNSGGAAYRHIYISNTMNATVTNGLVVSSKPVADNLTYSVS